MVTLYRQAAGCTFYWETWDEEDRIVVHHGMLGDTGEAVRLPMNGAARREVTAMAEQRRSEGYNEVPEEELARVILQYRIDGFGTVADLERRHQVEDLMNKRLGWTGLGRCDGGDIGSGTMNIWCLVMNPDTAVPVIIRELEQSGYLG